MEEEDWVSLTSQWLSDSVCLSCADDLPLTCQSIELPLWPWLVLADAACCYICHVIVLTLDGLTSHAAQHGKLPDMRQSVSNRALKELLGRGVRWLV